MQKWRQDGQIEGFCTKYLVPPCMKVAQRVDITPLEIFWLQACCLMDNHTTSPFSIHVCIYTNVTCQTYNNFTLNRISVHMALP